MKTQNKTFLRNDRMPPAKRFLDITASLSALIILSPLLILVAVLIKLESPGPVFYAAKRAGAGFNVFRLLKFRTMYADADQRLKSLKHLNLYAQEAAQETDDGCTDCIRLGSSCSSMFFAPDGTMICERRLLSRKQKEDSSAFLKIKDDPRITKVGKFLRNTSIDELPQLINVLKGDMSLVGNRPLPLYEAEKLTTDFATQRFLAPAGITGLWQVTKRGKSEMSAEERINLDKDYAARYTFMFDLKIILKTFPALLQKENV